MKYLKRILLTLMVLLGSVCSWAKIGPGLRLQFMSGNQITILLEDEPKLVFEKEDVVITTIRRTIRCESNDLLKLTYVNIGQLSIDEVAAEDVKVYFTDEGVSASNLKPHSQLSIYSQDGKCVCSNTVDDQGSVSVCFTAQEGMVYIIKTSTASFKMTKR